LPTLLQDKAKQADLVPPTELIGYLKTFLKDRLLSRTKRKVSEAKNIRIARDTIYANAAALVVTPGTFKAAIKAYAGATI
jgi:hypothetical protein